VKRLLLLCLAVLPPAVGAFAVGIGVHNAGPRRYSMAVGDGGSEWEMMIRFEGYDKAETLTNFPALVVFADGMSSNTFFYSQFAATNGYELRFKDSTKATELNYEIEKWDPTDLATYSPTNVANCVLWLDASQLSGLSDGQVITNWTDMSGEGNDATRDSGSTANYPQYKTNVVNSLPVVRFSTDASSGFNLTTPLFESIRTVFWVLKETTPGTHFLLGDSSDYNFHRDEGTPYYIWDSGYTAPSIKNGTTKLMGSEVDGTSTLLGTGFRLVSVVMDGTANVSQICKDRGNWGRSWDGDIAEIIIYDRALTTNEENEVGAYLSNKYALTTSYSTPGTSYVWVQVPAFTNNCYIWAYWGNAAYTSSPAVYTTNGATWDSTFAAVWHMNETNAQDSTTNQYNGTAVNNTNAAGVIGQAQGFNGSSAYVDMPDGFSDFTGGLTISVWGNPSSVASWSRFVDFGNGQSSDNIIFARNGASADLTYQVYSFDDAGAHVTASGALVLNTWQHLAVAQSGTTATIYTNGLKATSGSTTYVPENVTRTINYIGRSNWGADAYYGGMMDEVRIENVARSSNWVWACYMTMASNTNLTTYGTVAGGGGGTPP
jgi:hypothetical protein